MFLGPRGPLIEPSISVRPARAKNPDHLYSLINHHRTTVNLSNHSHDTHHHLTHQQGKKSDKDKVDKDKVDKDKVDKDKVEKDKADKDKVNKDKVEFLVPSRGPF